MEFSLLDLDDLGVVKYRYTEQDKKNEINSPIKSRDFQSNFSMS